VNDALTTSVVGRTKSVVQVILRTPNPTTQTLNPTT